jgi:5-(hydroxymethyl)furfural/furfural oxidase
VTKQFDVIIVGAGAAGCTLAGRLSEVLDRTVLLVEAGPDVPPGEEHPDIRDPFPISLANPRFKWSRLAVEVGGEPPHPPQPYPQGYGVGGGSNLIGMVALRGQPEDYEEWRSLGARGWGWEDVLPYFRKLERDLDYVGPLHGDHGPIPVRRVAPADWSPFAQALAGAMERRGFAQVDDMNADFSEGFGPIPMNNLPDARVSTAMAYLDAEVRRRPNLTIFADALAERVEITSGHATGVTVRSSGASQIFTARQTIVACGALFTPALLMRSGIGPAEHLRAIGVEVVHSDVEGVGQNLQNHADVNVAMHLPRRAVQPRALRAFGQNCLRYSSRLDGCAENDMLMVPRNKGSWHTLGMRIGSLGAYLYKPYSTGSVELVSTDTQERPRIQFNLISDSRDFERLVGGLRLALELLDDREVAAVRNEVFFPDTRLAFRLHERTRWNALRAAGISGVLDSGMLRRTLLPTLDAGSLVRDEGALREVVRQRIEPVGHVCGTCKMGSADDPTAVVDELCRVRGINGLRVVDASVFPTVPRANTHLPVIMTAEKMADQIKREWAA